MVLRQRSFPRHYELGKRIAVGGMGEVYEGLARDLDRPIAVKRMLKSDGSSSEVQELFLREVAVCATLEHPNVVEVIDAGPYESDLYLVMELVDGPSLAELLEALKRRSERLPVEIVCGITAQVARGLAHAHDRSLPDGSSLGIVHRDIAAENVLITRSGLPKLVDFGLATLSGHAFTTPGTIRGRPRALAPEQARGEKIDARTDIFALGAMMFELAAGEQLYPHEALAKMLWKVVGGDYEPIVPRLKDTDPDLVQIIQTAIEVDPKNRFRSAREVERALDKFRAARGMRIDTRRIVQLIDETWSEVERIREERKEHAPGELEGRELILAGDRLDTSSTFQVPDFVAEAGRRSGPGGSSPAAARPSSNPRAVPQRPISGVTPSKPRADSTTLAQDLHPRPPPAAKERDDSIPSAISRKPKEGGLYASYPGTTKTPIADPPPKEQRPPSFPPAREAPIAKEPAPEKMPPPPKEAAQPAETRASTKPRASTPRGAPVTMIPAEKHEQRWLWFLTVLLIVAVIVFVIVWFPGKS